MNSKTKEATRIPVVHKLNSNWFRALLGIAVLIAVALARADIRLRDPQDNEPPFYARIFDLRPSLGLEIFHNDDWAAIPFYRDPGCVPEDFNLLEFFDFTPAFPEGPPRPFLCPLTIKGFEVWKNGPGLDPAPIQVNFHGLGAVPIWFVSWPELQSLIADRVLTIGDLSNLASLRIGSAQLYTETLHPAESAQVGQVTIDARGTFADGTRFQLHVASKEPVLNEECCSSDVKNQQVRIRFQ